MQFPRVVEWWGKERPPCIIGTSVTKEFDVMEMVCQLPCLSILQTPWGHDLDENSVQASSILKPPCVCYNKAVVNIKPVSQCWLRTHGWGVLSILSK